MKTYLKLLSVLLVGLGIGIGIPVLAQNSPGGAFLTGFNYIIGGQWTWRGQASPFIFEGTTDDGFETTFTVTNPTADRTVTIQDATTTLVGRDTTDTLTNKTLTSPTVTTPTMTSGVSGSGTYTFPAVTGGMPILVSCGTATTCTNTATGSTAFGVTGLTTLVAGTAIVSGISPTFTTTSTGFCTGTDTSGGSGVLAEVIISGVSSLTVNGTGTGTVAWLCFGY